MNRPENPNLEDVIKAWCEDYLDSVHTANVGRVQSYDSDKQTADVVPLIRQPLEKANGEIEYEELPVLPSIPVVWPRVGGWFMAMGVAPGDTVLIVALENYPGFWLAGDGDAQDAGDIRRHHLANCVAIPGLYVHSRRITHAPPAPPGDGESQDVPALVIGSDAVDGVRVSFKHNGEFVVSQGAETVLRVDGDGVVHLAAGTAQNFVALANLVNDRLQTIANKHDTHTHDVATSGTATAQTGTAAPTTQSIGSLASVAAEKTKAR